MFLWNYADAKWLIDFLKISLSSEIFIKAEPRNIKNQCSTNLHSFSRFRWPINLNRSYIYSSITNDIVWKSEISYHAIFLRALALIIKNESSVASSAYSSQKPRAVFISASEYCAPGGRKWKPLWSVLFRSVSFIDCLQAALFTTCSKIRLKW